MECKGTRNTYFYLIIFINYYTGLLLCQGEQVKKQLTEVRSAEGLIYAHTYIGSK